jgi:hypothetical protein
MPDWNSGEQDGCGTPWMLSQMPETSACARGIYYQHIAFATGKSFH